MYGTNLRLKGADSIDKNVFGSVDVEMPVSNMPRVSSTQQPVTRIIHIVLIGRIDAML